MLAIDVGGIKAFLPGSLIDTKPVKNLDALKNHEYKFKIVSFDKKRNNIVLSRRAIVEVENKAAKVATFGRLQARRPALLVFGFFAACKELCRLGSECIDFVEASARRCQDRQ